MTLAVPALARRRRAIRRAAPAVALLAFCVAACTSVPETTITSLVSKPLPEMPGKEGQLIQVDYGPGATDPVHRHNAHAFVYVLEGSVVMQVRGGDEVKLTAGQTFYEGPDDVHVVGRNASSTGSARFLVFLVKNQGAPLLVPEK